MVKTIYLLRHAKSSWDNAELEDHDRPLSKRGRRSAGAVAAYLKRSQIAPDLVVCSSAERARQTLDLVSRAIKPSKVILDRNVYEAGPRKLMKYLCQLPEIAETVFLIGHNPALHELALSLADPTSAKRLPPVEGKFPTAALATFEFDGQWIGLAPHRARVTSFVIPAELQDDA